MVGEIEASQCMLCDEHDRLRVEMSQPEPIDDLGAWTKHKTTKIDVAFIRQLAERRAALPEGAGTDA